MARYYRFGAEPQPYVGRGNPQSPVGAPASAFASSWFPVSYTAMTQGQPRPPLADWPPVIGTGPEPLDPGRTARAHLSGIGDAIGGLSWTAVILGGVALGVASRFVTLNGRRRR